MRRLLLVPFLFASSFLNMGFTKGSFPNSENYAISSFSLPIFTSITNYEIKRVVNELSNALSQNKSGKYTYGPTPGPDPCGKTVWLCNGTEYTTAADYETTTCFAPPVPPKPPIPDRCRKFKPHPFCKFRPSYANHPLCKCK